MVEHYAQQLHHYLVSMDKFTAILQKKLSTKNIERLHARMSVHGRRHHVKEDDDEGNREDDTDDK